MFFAPIEPCACVTQTTLLIFFGAVFLNENNSGKTSSGIKGVLCKFEIMASAFSIFLHQYSADPCLTLHDTQ